MAWKKRLCASRSTSAFPHRHCNAKHPLQGQTKQTAQPRCWQRGDPKPASPRDYEHSKLRGKDADAAATYSNDVNNTATQKPQPSRTSAENGESPRSAQRRPTLPQPGAAVLSAKAGLTSGFGTGPGVSPPLWSLGRPGALAALQGTLAACIARKGSASSVSRR